LFVFLASFLSVLPATLLFARDPKCGGGPYLDSFASLTLRSRPIPSYDRIQDETEQIFFWSDRLSLFLTTSPFRVCPRRSRLGSEPPLVFSTPPPFNSVPLLLCPKSPRGRHHRATDGHSPSFPPFLLLPRSPRFNSFSSAVSLLSVFFPTS